MVQGWDACRRVPESSSFINSLNKTNVTQIKNYTPHPISICNNAGDIIRVIQPEGLVRLKAVTVPAGEIDGILITRTEFGQPEGLPDFKEGTFYIVSQLVKSALPSRSDLLVPAEVVRDEKGNIVGCRSLGL